jgi:hypothetical protein
MLQMIRSMRVMLAQKADPQDLLAVLAEARALLPPEFRRDGRSLPEPTSRLDGSTEEDLLWDALEEAVNSFQDEMTAMVATHKKRLFEAVLDVCYGCEQAIRDPKTAHLIPHVEKLRAAYLRDYGHPISTREETEERRRREPEGDLEVPPVAAGDRARGS